MIKSSETRYEVNFPFCSKRLALAALVIKIVLKSLSLGLFYRYT